MTRTNRSQTFKVRWGGQSFQYSLLKKSVNTFKWSGTQGEGTAPATPANVAAKADHDSVRLSWDFVYMAASHTVERAPAGGSFTTLATGVGTSSYDDTSAVAGTAYDYRVKAVNASGSSSASSVVSGTAGARDAFSNIEAEDFAIPASRHVQPGIFKCRVLGGIDVFASSEFIEHTEVGGEWQTHIHHVLLEDALEAARHHKLDARAHVSDHRYLAA